MRTQFQRFENQWYLEVTPSYHFTQDGFRLSRYFEERLSGIKMIERQNKVHLRQLRLWSEVLQQQHLQVIPSSLPQQRHLFGSLHEPDHPSVDPYLMIEFAPLVTFEVDYCVPESAWLPTEDKSSDNDDDVAQKRLFA
jgi:hypothetical protein